MMQQLQCKCTQKHQGILQAVRHGNFLNHLIASNLTEYHLLKTNSFVQRQKILDNLYIQNDVIDMLQNGAQLVNLKLSYSFGGSNALAAAAVGD